MSPSISVLGALLIVTFLLCCEARRRHSVSHTKAWYHTLKHKEGNSNSSKLRMTYNKKDCLDYTAMLAVVQGVVWLLCGGTSLALGFISLTDITAFMCAVLLLCFTVRHGLQFTARPLLFAQPMLAIRCFWYKLENVRAPYYASACLLLLEQIIVAATPQWAHQCDYCHRMSWMTVSSLVSFVTVVRVVSFLCHIYHRKHVFEFLSHSNWSKMVKRDDGTRQMVDLVHALATGVLCHILALLPFIVILSTTRCSMLLLPVRVLLDLCVMRWWAAEANSWLYRDHWLCHHCEFTFLYLHGPHHDALPTAIMAAHDTGMLEGFLRFSLAQPDCFFTPLLSAVLFSLQVLADMKLHQYVPGVWPHATAVVSHRHHHVEHHFLSLFPLSSGFETHSPDGNKALNVEIDKRLDAYEPNNGVWKWFCEEVRKYEGEPRNDVCCLFAP